jgi:hypothetical protein
VNDDFLDLLRELTKSEARFIVVGAYAMAVHGTPRSTGDIDIWIEPTATNAQRVWQALGDFGAPLDDLGVTQVDLQTHRFLHAIGVVDLVLDLIRPTLSARLYASSMSKKRTAAVILLPLALTVPVGSTRAAS